MKKLLTAILAALLIAAPACADNVDLLALELAWSDRPDTAIHLYPDCSTYGADLTEYTFRSGTLAEAFDAGIHYLCIECFARLCDGLHNDAMLFAINQGISVPPGTYVAGDDLPAGKYTVRVEDDVLAATVEVGSPEPDAFRHSYWLGSMYGGPVANITLEEGQALVVNSKTVTLTLYKGLLNTQE